MGRTTLGEGQRVWVEHPEHGTIEAVVAMVSPNQLSLALMLATPISRAVGGGLAVTNVLPLLRNNTAYQELTSGEQWQIYLQQPKKMIPTK
jgi:hypothetical protein